MRQALFPIMLTLNPLGNNFQSKDIADLMDVSGLPQSIYLVLLKENGAVIGVKKFLK